MQPWAPHKFPIPARRHVARHRDQSPALGLEGLSRPFFPDAIKAEEHYADVPNARTRDERVMNAQGQHLPPQALAGMRDYREMPSPPEIQKPAKRDQRRLKIHDPRQVVHQGNRPFQQRAARYVEANGARARAKQDMLAVLPADDRRPGSALDKIERLRLPVHNGQGHYLKD